MPAFKSTPKINLLPQKGLASTTAGRVLAWVLTTFRIIVILTEIVVMLAFFSRFWLDANNTNLNELIENKQAVIASSSEFEKEFRNTQERIRIYSELTNKENTESTIIDNIKKYVPENIILTAINLNEKKITIEGTSPTEKSIQQLMVNLESDELFEGVGLISAETSQENQSLLLFKISVTNSSSSSESE